MYLVISFCNDIFYEDITCHFELSDNLKPLFEKYGKPSIPHMIEKFEEGATIFELNYFKVDFNEFNLYNSYLTYEKINEILETESSEQLDLIEINNITTQYKSDLENVVKDINYFQHKIFDLLQNNSDKEDLFILEMPKNNTNKKVLRKYIKMRKEIIDKYKTLSENGIYYLLIYFDINIINDFKKESESTTNEFNMYYGRKPNLGWTNIQYELYWHRKAHFKIFNNISNMIKYIDDVIPNGYDNSNIFYTKFNKNKEFNFEMSNINQIWFKDDKHYTMITPARFTHNKFFDVKVELIKQDETTQTYKSIEPTNDFNHMIHVIVSIPNEKSVIKYYNNLNTSKCTIGDIGKSNYKYKLEHFRL